MGFLSLLVMAGFAVMVVGSAIVMDARLQGSVDRSALAGADVARGVVPGIPCEHAQDLLESEGFALVGCTLKEDSIRVVGQGNHVGVEWTRRARAGVGQSGQK
jgi:secretion/DNA translocation related TadE-like protein